MPKVKSIDELSARELYKLAEKREKQEQQRLAEENKAKIEALKNKRKALIASHRKEITAIDRQLKKLTGSTATKKTKNNKSTTGTTEKIINLLATNKTMTTVQIRAALQENGLTVNNLSQTLAYLKRTKRITSPARSTYALT